THAPRERIHTIIAGDHDDIAALIAGRIAELIRTRNAAGQVAVLGLATGSTPIGIYRALIRMHREEGLSFARVETFNLDEYWPMPKDSIHSYHRFLWEHLFSHVELDPANVHTPPGEIRREKVGEAARAYEAAIAAA